jgi:gamma-butyrobetaine dioxygenase
VIDCSVVPARTDDPATARALVRSDGAAILTGWGTTADEARAAALAVFGADVLAVPEPARVYEGGEGDRRPFGSHEPLPLHTDGFAYGGLACDHFLLTCVIDGETGGESVLVDGYALVDALATEEPELHEFVTGVDIDQTEPDMRPFVAPLVHQRTNGRRVVRRPGFVLPAPTSTDPEHDRAMMRRWSEVTEQQRHVARRFRLAPGEVACVDNDRMLHSRDAFTGERLLYRVWIWTVEGDGTPDGMLHSDARYATVDGGPASDTTTWNQ